MLAEDFGSQTHCFVRSQGPVGKYIQGQLVVIRYLAHTGILDGHVHPLNRGVDGIHRNHTDGQVIALVLVCADISASSGDGQLHVELAVRAAA